MEFFARGIAGKVAAILINVEWDGALQIRSKGKAGHGDHAVRAFSKGRKYA